MAVLTVLMVSASQRTTIRAPAFVRRLAQLADAVPTDAIRSLPDRLGQWLDWNHALALSTALEDKANAAFDAPVSVEEIDQAAQECVRVREALATATIEACASAVEAQRSAPDGADDGAVDFEPFRKACLARQRAALAATGRLRGWLRERVARQSPAMARLAELDAVMEQTLSPREQASLAAVPDLLGRRFQRLCQSVQPSAALETFGRDMQGVLLAELDVRFQPVEGLLAALRAR